MARIRSIHPATLTDPEFASIPIPGRLQFIYSLIIADDAGNLERSPKGMKMAMFPVDDDMTIARISELTDVLIAGRFYLPYEVDGKAYLHIRNFKKYQKPDHPTRNRFPLYPGQEFTFHARKGNTWESVTVKNATKDLSKNIQRTYPESTSNVLAGEEMERKGEDLDLERRGKERMGKNRGEKHALPSPPSGGGRATALKDKGNSGTILESLNPQTTAVASGNRKPDWRLSVEYARDEINAGNLTPSQARNALLWLGATESELDELFPDEVTN